MFIPVRRMFVQPLSKQWVSILHANNQMAKSCWFTKKNLKKTVDKFESEIPKDAPYEMCINHLQTYLLGTLRDASIVGRYSMFWEHSIYQNGYWDWKTLILASLFCTVLDGAKTGISVDPSKFDEHKKKYSIRPALSWKDLKEGHWFDMSNAPTSKYLKRPKHLGVFIMDDSKSRCLLSASGWGLWVMHAVHHQSKESLQEHGEDGHGPILHSSYPPQGILESSIIDISSKVIYQFQSINICRTSIG